MFTQILNTIITFCLFCTTLFIGTYYDREFNKYYLMCPSMDNGNKLVQSISDGKEVICIYTQDPMKKGRYSNKLGYLSK